MNAIRDELAEVCVIVGAAATLSDGSERAVRQSLAYVQDARRGLQDVEARLRTILRACETAAAAK